MSILTRNTTLNTYCLIRGTTLNKGAAKVTTQTESVSSKC